MNNIDKEYQILLEYILGNGHEKKDRTGIGTLSTFGWQIRHKMSEGFPLLTTKRMYWKGIVTELLWFLRGDTNIKYLVDNDCHIWDGDAYKKYADSHTIPGNLNGRTLGEQLDSVIPMEHSRESFIEKIKTDDEFAKKWGELGPIYGKMWRDWDEDTGVKIDQISNLIEQLKTNPDSRRLMVNAWNPTYLPQMTLPPCHYGFQVYTRELSLDERKKYHPTPDMFEDIYGWSWTSDMGLETLDDEYKKEIHLGFDKLNIPTRAISLMWNQRSVDTFLGLPFNIASYGLLLEIIAKEVNMVPDELIGNLGDVHLYKNHIEQAKEQIGRELSMEEKEEWCRNNSNHMDCPMYTREPYPLPTLKYTVHLVDNLGLEVFKNLEVEQFEIENYQSHPTIKAPLNN